MKVAKAMKITSSCIVEPSRQRTGQASKVQRLNCDRIGPFSDEIENDRFQGKCANLLQQARAARVGFAAGGPYPGRPVLIGVKLKRRRTSVSARSFRKVLAVLVGAGVFTSSAANAATMAPPSVDPLFVASVLGTSSTRTSATLAPAAYSLAAAQDGSDGSYNDGSGMWALWVGLAAVAAFIIWDLADEHDDDDDDIVVPVSP